MAGGAGCTERRMEKPKGKEKFCLPSLRRRGERRFRPRTHLPPPISGSRATHPPPHITCLRHNTKHSLPAPFPALVSTPNSHAVASALVKAQRKLLWRP